MQGCPSERLDESLSRFVEGWWVAVPDADRGGIRLFCGRLDASTLRRLTRTEDRQPVFVGDRHVSITWSVDYGRLAWTLHPISLDHARVLSIGLYPWYYLGRAREVLSCSPALCRASLALAGLGGWPERAEDLPVIAEEVHLHGGGSPVDLLSMIVRLRTAGFDGLDDVGAEIAAGLAEGWSGTMDGLVELAADLAAVAP